MEYKNLLIQKRNAFLSAIEKYEFIYDFNIYEQGLKVFWDDWFTIPDKDKPGTWFTYVPADGELPQYLYHEVIEHQKIKRR